jgi:hypothetical protein
MDVLDRLGFVEDDHLELQFLHEFPVPPYRAVGRRHDVCIRDVGASFVAGIETELEAGTIPAQFMLPVEQESRRHNDEVRTRSAKNK